MVPEKDLLNLSFWLISKSLRLDPMTGISGTEVPVPDSTRFLRCNSKFAIHLSFFAWLPFFFDEVDRGANFSPVCMATGG
jgi:hypothetical protein